MPSFRAEKFTPPLETIPSMDGLDAFAIFKDAQGIKRFVLSKE